MKNLISFLSILILLFIQQSFACISQPSTVDLDKVKKTVSVKTKNMVILVSKEKVILVDNESFQLKALIQESVFRLGDKYNRNKYYIKVKTYPVKTNLKLQIGKKEITLELDIQKEDVSFQNESLGKSKSIPRGGCGGAETIKFD